MEPVDLRFIGEELGHRSEADGFRRVLPAAFERPERAEISNRKDCPERFERVDREGVFHGSGQRIPDRIPRAITHGGEGLNLVSDLRNLKRQLSGVFAKT